MKLTQLILLIMRKKCEAVDSGKRDEAIKTSNLVKKDETDDAGKHVKRQKQENKEMCKNVIFFF